MSLSRAFSRSVCLGAMVAFAGLVAVAPNSMAQTPEAGADGPHPAHIHSGSCAELGDVVYPLTDVAMPEGEQVGAATAHPVKVSHTVVDASLQDIVASPHAINVHLSADEIGTYIACGDIGGIDADDDGREEVMIALGELNDSDHVGIAWLGADGEQTEVTVVLFQPSELDDDGMDHDMDDDTD